MTALSISNARNASNSIYLQSMSELGTGHSGIYIGKTAIYGTPFMLNLQGNINPHFAVIGMTGSGKTYLTKSIALRAALYKDYKLLIIDWNGEYAQVIKFLNGMHVRLGMREQQLEPSSMLHGIYDLGKKLLHENICVGMSELRDSESKASASKSLLRAAICAMHGIDMEKHGNAMIVIDEAWRMLTSSDEIFTLFREGRKYGVSIAIATQMASDINNAVIANAGCIILFKLQNPDDYEMLKAANILGGASTESPSMLGVGSCIIHQNNKDSTVSHFVIAHVDGVDADGVFVSGDRMQVYVPSGKFFSAAEALGENVKAEVSNLAIENNRRVDLQMLIMLLMKCGLDRPKILGFLYSIGIDGVSIVIAYEKAEAFSNTAKQ